jgi:hypothetical protein
MQISSWSTDDRDIYPMDDRNNCPVDDRNVVLEAKIASL